MEGLALASMGRHEEALAIFDATIALGRELGRSVRVVLNYSSMAFRDLLDTAEARRRSEEAIDMPGPRSFNMPKMQSRVDLLFTDLIEGEIGRAQAAWPALWDEARNGKAWHRWLVRGRLAAARAEIALRMEPPEDAAKWAHEAIEIARPVRRLKYETAARAILGQALLGLKRGGEAVSELRTAVDGADRLGGPPGRWQARAALAHALHATGDDDGAASVFRESAEIIRTFAATLSPEHAKPLLAASPVQDILKAGA